MSDDPKKVAMDMFKEDEDDGTQDIPDTVKPLPINKPGSVYVPSVEKSEHRAMFTYYYNLGKDRTLAQVSKEFGKSLTFISNISRAFSWKDRITQYESEIKDPVIKETRGQVDNSRRQLVGVANEIVEILSEIADISKRLRTVGSVTDVDEARIALLRTALSAFGIELKTPRAMKDVLSTMRDVVRFNQETGQQSGGRGALVGRVDKMQLVIRDD